MKKYHKEIIGIYFFFISTFILLSLFSHKIIGNNVMGPVGNEIAKKLITYLGIGSYVIPIIIGMYGYLYFTGKNNKYSLGHFKISLHLINISIWVSTFIAFLSDIFTLNIIQHYSGIIGISLSYMFTSSIGYIFTGIILFLYIIIINMIIFNFSLFDILISTKNLVIESVLALINKAKLFRNKVKEEEIKIEHFNNEEIIENSNNLDIDNDDDDGYLVNSPINEDESNDIDINDNNIILKEDVHIEDEVEEEHIDIDSDEERKKKYFKYNLPQSNILSTPIEVGSKYSESELHEKSEELMYALETFGVKGKVKRINQGPVITLFEIEPDEGVRVNKFVNLSDDLSRVMKASKVRVIAPIPGT